MLTIKKTINPKTPIFSVIFYFSDNPKFNDFYKLFFLIFDFPEKSKITYFTRPYFTFTITFSRKNALNDFLGYHLF